MNSNKELVYEEDVVLKYITGHIAILRNNEDGTFTADLYVSELLEHIRRSDFATQDEAETWVWERAYQEDDNLGD